LASNPRGAPSQHAENGPRSDGRDYFGGTHCFSSSIQLKTMTKAAGAAFFSPTPVSFQHQESLAVL